MSKVPWRPEGGNMKILGLFLLLPVSVALRGLMLKCFWGWFVLPVFELPALGFLQAVGLAVALSAFSGDTHTPYRVEAVAKAVGAEDDALEGAVRAILHPLFMLALGWVFHLFM
jgi:hypothetical protein